jgi:hypothetical protein
MEARFELGEVVCTPAALVFLEEAGVSPASLLRRHTSGDWGDVPEVAAIENEFSVQEGYRILSRYPVEGEHVWIITKADRSATTILLPKEY